MCTFLKRGARRCRIVNKHVEDPFRAYLALKIIVRLQEPRGYKYTQAAPRSVCQPVCVPARWCVCRLLQQHDVNRLPSTQWPLSRRAECREVQTAAWRAQTTQAENKQGNLGAGGGRHIPTRCSAVGDELSERSLDRLVQSRALGAACWQLSQNTTPCKRIQHTNNCCLCHGKVYIKKKGTEKQGLNINHEEKDDAFVGSLLGSTEAKHSAAVVVQWWARAHPQFPPRFKTMLVGITELCVFCDGLVTCPWCILASRQLVGSKSCMCLW